MYSAGRVNTASKPLRDLKGYPNIATVLIVVEDQPLVFHSVAAHSDKHKHSHARLLPVIKAQI